MYTTETVAIARMLIKHPQARNEVRHILREASKPTYYSNQDFDRIQHLATVLYRCEREARAGRYHGSLHPWT